MPTLTDTLAFAFIALGMVLTPGPNMAYLVSRSVSQGRAAGLISLGGIATGLLFYMLCAAFGLTTLLLAVPYAYDIVRLCGAAYLLWLAWQSVRPGGRSPFQLRDLAPDSPRKLYGMGLMTALLNPKLAVLYLSLLPQFAHPARGGVLSQLLTLGLVQIAISLVFNGLIVLSAASVARFFAGRPFWTTVQRWLMGTVLAGFAVRIVTEAQR